MRKAAFFFLAIIIFPCVAFSASTGGMTTAGKGKVTIGFDEDMIFDRDLAKKDKFMGVDGASMTSEIDSINRSMVQVGYGLLGNLDLYVKLGTADFKSIHKYSYADPSDSSVFEKATLKFDGDNAFAYGVGLKAAYELSDGWLIGGNAQFLAHKNDFSGSNIGEDSDGGTWDYKYTGDISFSEWQAGFSVGKKIGSFTPYAGVKYSDLRANCKIKDETDESLSIKFKADDNVGAYLGVDYNINDNLALNAEGRFIDETAATISLNYKF